MMKNPGIIISLDCLNLEDFTSIIEQTYSLEKVIGYKINAALTILHSLPTLSRIIRERNPYKRIIFDLQKAGTDIPETGNNFAAAVARSTATDVILFPLMGLNTAQTWIRACKDAGLRVLVGAFMTHSGLYTIDNGFVDKHRLFSIFDVALENDVKDIVIPGVHRDLGLSRNLVQYLCPSVLRPLTFYAPGIGAQGGSIIDLQRVTQQPVVPIIGRAITCDENPKQTAQHYISLMGEDD